VSYRDWLERDLPISSERLPRLRLAIRSGRLSFPAQVPVFSRQNRPDAQWRIVVLYFVQGWSFVQLAQRYGVTPGRIRQVLRKWVQRAAMLGYVQWVPPQDTIGIETEQFMAAASGDRTAGLPVPPATILQLPPAGHDYETRYHPRLRQLGR